MTALEAFLASLPSGATTLNIGGARTGEVAAMLKAGLLVTAADYAVTGVRYEQCPSRPQFYDGIFTSHTLEHVRNVGVFLDKLYLELKDNGVLCIVVPPLKHEIVGGHLSLWNAGLLLYNLIRAGFDCSRAHVATYDYNVAVLLRKLPIRNYPALAEDNGDIEALAQFFPLPVAQGFDGRISRHRWGPV